MTSNGKLLLTSFRGALPKTANMYARTDVPGSYLCSLRFSCAHKCWLSCACAEKAMTADVQQCCAVVLHEIERGVVFLRNSHNLSGDIAEICQRRAERLVQWTLAIKSLVVDGESLFQAILGIREAIDAEVQENTRPKRGRPSILISEHQLLFLLEHGFTVAQMAAFFGCSQRTVER